MVERKAEEKSAGLEKTQKKQFHQHIFCLNTICGCEHSQNGGPADWFASAIDVFESMILPETDLNAGNENGETENTQHTHETASMLSACSQEQERLKKLNTSANNTPAIRKLVPPHIKCAHYFHSIEAISLLLFSSYPLLFSWPSLWWL